MGFWGALYTIIIIGSPQNSIVNYFGPYITASGIRAWLLWFMVVRVLARAYMQCGQFCYSEPLPLDSKPGRRTIPYPSQAQESKEDL